LFTPTQTSSFLQKANINTRLITRNTIEEQILQLANTKLALDQSISEGDEKAIEGKGEELVAKMLLQSTAATTANDEEKE